MKLAVLAPLFLAAISSPTFADDLSDTLMRIGLDAGSMAASSVQSSEVAGIATNVRDYLDANSTELSSADAAFLSAKQDVSALSKLVNGGEGTAQDATDLATALAALDTAETDRDAAIDALFDAGIDDLTAAQSTALSNIRANKHWGLPIEFAAKNRTDQDWLSLAEALTDERVSALEEVSASAACVALLLSERSDSAVSTAKTAYDTNLTAVKASWASAVSGS